MSEAPPAVATPIAAPSVLHEGPTRSTATPERWSTAIQNFGTPAALVLMILFFTVFTDNFANVSNFRNVLIQISPLLIVALGITVPMSAGDYDLSVGANASFVGILCAGLMANGPIHSMPLAMVTGAVIGIAVGLVNGFLISRIGFPSLIATLAMMSVLEGINTAYSGGLSIYNGIPESFTNIATGRILHIPTLVVIAVACSVAGYVLMHRRPTGRHLYAIGSNYSVARLVGIRIAPSRTFAMVVSGAAAALAGMLLAARLGAGIPSAGNGFLLSSLTVVFLGMTMYRVGRANVPGTIVGALFTGALQNGLNIMGVDSAGQSLATGFVLMAAVAFAVFRNRNRD